MNLLLAILAFNIIVIIHELGHFIVARLFKIKVYEFSLFIGPKIYSFQHKETTFSLRLIPMLAYVAFDKEDSVYEDKSLNQHPVHARAAVIAAGPVFNIIAGCLAFAFMFAASGGYRTNTVGKVLPDTPAYYADLAEGDRVVGFNGKRIFTQIEMDMFVYNISKGNTVQLEVIRAGSREREYLDYTPQVVPENRPMLGFQAARDPEGIPTNKIESIVEGSPAEIAGLKPGDVIVQLDNKKISNMQQILNFMYENKGAAVKVTVLRTGAILPPMDIVPKRGVNPEGYNTGINFSFEKGTALEMLRQSAVYTYSFSRLGIYSIGWLIQGKVPFNQMTGAVGAVDAINTAVQMGTNIKEVLIQLFFLSAIINIGLGITNLLPIPPADGSKLIILAVEAVRRKPLPQEKEAMIMMAGFVLMILLFALTLYNDIARILVRSFGG